MPAAMQLLPFGWACKVGKDAAGEDRWIVCNIDVRTGNKVLGLYHRTGEFSGWNGFGELDDNGVNMRGYIECVKYDWWYFWDGAVEFSHGYFRRFAPAMWRHTMLQETAYNDITLVAQPYNIDRRILELPLFIQILDSEEFVLVPQPQ